MYWFPVVTVKVFVVYPVCIVVPPDISVVQSPVIVLPVSPTDFTVKDTEDPVVAVLVVADMVFDGKLVPTELIAEAR